MALVYATSPRGACHNQSDYFMVDVWKPEPSIGIEYHSRHGGAEKAAGVAHHQDWRSVCNSLVMCIFANLEPELIVPLINAACGLSWSLEDMLKCGERGWNLKRAINNRFGLTRANDKLPKALLEPYKDAELKDSAIRIDLAAMLEAYYQARGWDPDSGYPSIEKLKELQLDFILPDLYPGLS
jgi:aldehyde:ferredoxin oxidoreductase